MIEAEVGLTKREEIKAQGKKNEGYKIRRRVTEGAKESIKRRIFLRHSYTRKKQ